MNTNWRIKLPNGATVSIHRIEPISRRTAARIAKKMLPCNP